MLKLLALLAVFMTPDAAADQTPAPGPVLIPIPVQVMTPAVVQATKPVQKCQKHPCVAVGDLTGVIVDSDSAKTTGIAAEAKESQADALVYIIDSIGGDWNVARQIFKTVQSSAVPFYCYVNGDADSSAFWILQACKERAAAPDAMLMVHQAYIVYPAETPLTRNELVESLSNIDATNGSMFANIAPRMGITIKALSDRCAEGNWHFSAASALQNRAIDVVVDGGSPAYILRVKSLIKQR